MGPDAVATLAHGVGQGHQIVVVAYVGRGPAWRTSSQPRGAVIRPAWMTHRSHECGSETVASGPTTAVESE